MGNKRVIVHLNGNPESIETISLDNSIDSIESLKREWARVFQKNYHEESRLFYFNDGTEIEEEDLFFLKDQDILWFSHKGAKFKYKQILEMYTVISKLGQGGFGKVYLAEENSTKQQYAIKYIDITLFMTKADLVKEIFRESKILSVLQHKNIVSLKEAFLYENNIVLIMEYAADGELK